MRDLTHELEAVTFFLQRIIMRAVAFQLYFLDLDLERLSALRRINKFTGYGNGRSCRVFFHFVEIFQL